MYNELVKALRETRERVKSTPGVAMFVPPYQLSEAADVIEGLSHAVDQMTEWRKNPWIPVTEQLPEKFENVLLANKRGKHYDIDKGWWNGSIFDRCAKGSYSNVTHWMPLPEPPMEV